MHAHTRAAGRDANLERTFLEGARRHCDRQLTDLAQPDDEADVGVTLDEEEDAPPHLSHLLREISVDSRQHIAADISRDRTRGRRATRIPWSAPNAMV